jgi:hypothetical protein
MNWYVIHFRYSGGGQFDSVQIYAESPGAAKYKYWLNFRDVYNVPFGDFVSRVNCRKVRVEEHGQPNGG